MSRRSSDVLYVLLRAGSLLKVEFVPAEQRVVFRFGQFSHDETVAIAVGLLDLDRLVRLFQAARADAKARGYLADAITRTVITPGGKPSTARPGGRGADQSDVVDPGRPVPRLVDRRLPPSRR